MAANINITSSIQNPIKVGYVFNKELLCFANKLPEVKGRAIFVHQLIAAYGLLKSCYHVEVVPSNDEELRRFHTAEYIDFVKKVSNLENEDILDDEDCDAFGLGYDCFPIPHLYTTISYLAASSISAAKAIINKQCHMVVNWFGGWHHGFKDEASGFCYTNDIVLMILTFLENGFKRILYIDLDLHHGNAVEDAFSHTDKVVTFSIHKSEFGFFPGTGAITDIGSSKGKYYSINMPLSDGINDQQYTSIFSRIINKLIPKYQPQVVICQCGADTLTGDRMNSFNLTLDSYNNCINKIITFGTPAVFLGGGGYNIVNTAKLWTSITATVLGKTLDENIPEHDLFIHYGPSYELTINASTRPNHNGTETVENNLQMILANIDQMS